MKDRKLTISKDYHSYQLKRPLPGPPVPWIRLKGYWIKRAGFDIGMPVRIQVKKKRLIITPIH